MEKSLVLVRRNGSIMTQLLNLNKYLGLDFKRKKTRLMFDGKRLKAYDIHKNEYAEYFGNKIVYIFRLSGTYTNRYSRRFLDTLHFGKEKCWKKI